MTQFFTERGKILRIKTGYNPNSSSIGTNLTPLIIAGSVLSVLLPLIGLLVARVIKKNKQKKGG